LKAILFGATGMVGQGVLRECLRNPSVEQVLAIVRSRSGQQYPKLIELVQKDLFTYSDIESQLTGYDTCFFCLGVTSSGMTEQDYSRITYDLTISAAETLVRLNPLMTFLFISGAGTDSTERGRAMWPA
jgi:putative NADH-flavin reductase